MNGKVKVIGKAQNRIALGIVKAWVKMNPRADLSALKQAFPHSLNPDSGVKANFITEEAYNNRENKEWKGYFAAPEEVITLGKERIVVVSMWTKNSYDRIVEKAATYGIAVEKNESLVKTSKLGFKIECLNGYKFPKVGECLNDNKSPQNGGCLGMMLALIALGGGGMYMLFS